MNTITSAKIPVMVKGVDNRARFIRYISVMPDELQRYANRGLILKNDNEALRWLKGENA